MATLKTVALCSVMALLGCAAPGMLMTPSGRPEVLLPDISPEEASALCVARLQSEGYTIEDVTPYRVVGATADIKETGVSATAMFLFLGEKGRARIAFTIIRSGDNCTVYASLQLVRSKIQGWEGEMSVVDYIQQKHFDTLQLRLEAIRDDYLQAKGLPPLPSVVQQKTPASLHESAHPGA